MNNINGDLANEGTISFWIRLNKNPSFKDPKSNIKFMLDQGVGGVSVTILKEKNFLALRLDNPKYGVAHIRHEISHLLDQDVMVAVTWKEGHVILYLNGEAATSTESTEQQKGISVVLGEETEELMTLGGLTVAEVEITINNRDRGILMQGNPLRLGAVHWFEKKIVFVSGAITRAIQAGNTLKLEECTVSVALHLAHHLPTGSINPNMTFNEILGVVASSFGILTKCTRDGNEAYLHLESDWEPDGFSFQGQGSSPLLVQGTFSPDQKKASYVWVFCFQKYRDWIHSQA